MASSVIFNDHIGNGGRGLNRFHKRINIINPERNVMYLICGELDNIFVGS